MPIKTLLVSFLLGAMLAAQATRNLNIPLKNWPAPLYWQASQAGTEVAIGPPRAELKGPSQLAATTTSPLVFVAMTPCRVVDTRGSQMFPSPFGTPSLMSGVMRNFPIQSSTLCTIPSTAQAYSFNVTVIPPGPLGYLTLWPEGQSQPNAVTLDDYPTGDIRNNAAIVPAGTPNGGISAITNGTTDLVIDINGYYAPLNLSDLGNGNMAIGFGALFNTTGGSNTASGDYTLFFNTTGNGNTANGYEALAGSSGLSGSYNTAMGFVAGYVTTGINNTALGYEAGINITTGNDNIDIANGGLSGDSGVIRIGGGSQTQFFTGGISGVGVSGSGVVVNSSGQLGIVLSSRRFKEDIQDMDDASDGLLRLRPVTFRYQKPYEDGSKPLDYGLIAEEVAEVYPDLVVKGADGQVETVQYHKLTPMLLNEMQKEHAALEQAYEMIRSLQAQVTALSQQISNQR